MRPAALASVLLCAAVLLGQEARGQAPATFTAITTALTSAAQAIGALVENLEKATRSGLRTYDLVAARRASEALRAISGQAAALPGEQRMLVLDPLDEYLQAANAALKRGAPLPPAEASRRWTAATGRLEQIVPKVEGLLADVKAAAPSFVDPQPYNAFVAALGGRRLVLAELKKLPPPRTREDVARLQTLHDRYAELLAQLARANTALEQYIVKSTAP